MCCAAGLGVASPIYFSTVVSSCAASTGLFRRVGVVTGLKRSTCLEECALAARGVGDNSARSDRARVVVAFLSTVGEAGGICIGDEVVGGIPANRLIAEGLITNAALDCH